MLNGNQSINQSSTGGPLTFFEPRSYKMATEFMLAHPYGFTRVMSSYSWNRNFQGGEDHNNWQGPPHNGDMSIKSPSIQSDNSCGNGWVGLLVWGVFAPTQDFFTHLKTSLIQVKDWSGSRYKCNEVLCVIIYHFHLINERINYR